MSSGAVRIGPAAFHGWRSQEVYQTGVSFVLLARAVFSGFFCLGFI